LKDFLKTLYFYLDIPNAFCYMRKSWETKNGKLFYINIFGSLKRQKGGRDDKLLADPLPLYLRSSVGALLTTS